MFVCIVGVVLSWVGEAWDTWCPNQILQDTGTQLLTVCKTGLRGIPKYVCVCVCVYLYIYIYIYIYI